MVQIACLPLGAFRKTSSLFSGYHLVVILLVGLALYSNVSLDKLLCYMLQNKLTKHTCNCLPRPTATSRDAGHKHKQWDSLAILEKKKSNVHRVSNTKGKVLTPVVSMLHFDLPFLSKSCSRVEEVSSGVLQNCVDFNTIMLSRARIAVSCGNVTMIRLFIHLVAFRERWNGTAEDYDC